MWTLLNQTGADIVVGDIPEPQTLSAFSSGSFLLRDVLTSRTLSVNLGNGALVVTNMASFATSEAWAPLSYEVNNGAAQVTTNGQTTAFTMAVFRQAALYANV